MRAFSRLLAVLAWAGAVLAVLLACFAIATTFPAGRAAIAALATRVVSATTEIDLRIEGLDRLTPVAVDLKRAQIAMQGEQIAAVEGLHLRLRWTDLLRGRLRPSLVHVEQLAINALPPAGDESEAPEASEGVHIALPLLPVEAIRIDRLILAESVLGEAAELRISATETDASGEHAIDAELLRTDRPGDGATLRVRYRPDAATLDVRVVAAEAAGGLLARKLGASPEAGLRAELAGAGPVEAWRGRLTAGLDGVASINADLGIDKGIGVIVGEARVEPAVLPDFESLLRDPINYRARLRWSEAEGLHIESSRIRIADIVLGLIGTVAPDMTDLQLQLSGDLPLAALTSFAGTPLDGSVGFLFHVVGPPSRPGIAGDLALSEPRFGTIGSANALIRLEARADRDGRYEVEIGGNLAGLSGVPPALEPFVAGRIDLEAMLEISAAADEIRLSQLSLQGAAMRVEGDAVLRPVAGESRGRVSLQADMSPGIGPVTGGHAALELTGTADIAAGSFRGDGNLQVEGLALSDAALGNLIGTAPRLAVTVTGAGGMPVRLEQARVQLAAGDMTANGTFDADADELAVDVTAEVPDLSRISDLVGQTLSGRGEMTAHVSGPSGDPAARGKVTVAGVAFGPQRVDRGELSFDLRRLVSEPQGDLAATVRSGGADHRLSMDARLRNRTELNIAKLVAATPGLAANGDLTLDLAHLLARGRLNVTATDLAPAAAMAGVPLKGRGQVSLRLDGVNGRQQVAADLRADGLQYADMVLGRLEGRAKIDDVLGTPRADLSFVGRDVRAQGASLSRWQLAAKGDLARATVDLSLNGDADGPISARAAGVAGVEGTRWQVGLRSFEARHRDVAMKLERATELRGDAGMLRLAATEVTVGGAKVRLGGGLEKGRVDAYLRAGAFPLSLLRAVQPDLPIRGHVEIDLSANGPAAEPRIVGKLRSNDLRLPRGEGEIALDLEATLAEGRLASRATIGNLADQPLVATATAPMRLGLVPWRFELPEGPIEGRLDGKVDLARVLPPFIPDGDRVRGVADMHVALRGTLSRPVATGTAKMSGGRYENANAEATIADLALDLAADGDAVRLTARGTDGNRGTLALDGRLNLAAADQPVAGKLVLRDFWVAHRADASVRMAGDVDLAGTMTAPRLVGKLAILQADLQLPEQLPPEVVKLDVVEVNGVGNIKPSAAPPAKPAEEDAFKVGLDLAITADRRVFVRGRGLESEWRGNLRVRGDTAAPDISGTLEAINGRLDFLAERFLLTKGKLLFPGGTRIDPDLDVVTELTRGDLTAIVNIAGTLSAPELKLSARPDLPPEEVVSRILFDKGAAKLTPLQAVQVAQSVMMLAGRGGGPGVMDRLRRATGVDVIDFESGEGEGSAGAVSVGKYVSDNVLLRAEKGLDSTGPRAGVEVEVTPNISVESKVGTNAVPSVGIKLKKDY